MKTHTHLTNQINILLNNQILQAVPTSSCKCCTQCTALSSPVLLQQPILHMYSLLQKQQLLYADNRTDSCRVCGDVSQTAYCIAMQIKLLHCCCSIWLPLSRYQGSWTPCTEWKNISSSPLWSWCCCVVAVSLWLVLFGFLHNNVYIAAGFGVHSLLFCLLE